MGYERESDLVIADVDIGMMAGLFGEVGDVANELHCFPEVLEGDGSN
jgi:hypothetical protein